MRPRRPAGHLTFLQPFPRPVMDGATGAGRPGDAATNRLTLIERQVVFARARQLVDGWTDLKVTAAIVPAG